MTLIKSHIWEIVFVTISFCLYSGSLTAQGFDYNWLTKNDPDGPGVKITYNPNLDDIEFTTFENDFRCFENHMMSDTLGSILYLSSGLQLYSSDFALLPGGDSLFIKEGFAEEAIARTDGHPFLAPEGLVTNIIPLQGEAALHLHYSYRDRFSSGFNIDIVDTAGWELIEYCENVYSSYIVYSDDSLHVDTTRKLDLFCEGKFVATSNTLIKHANGIDWWLHLPLVENDSVKVILIDGVNGDKVDESTYYFSPSNQIATNSSYMFPSPDGTSMARFVYRSGGHPTDLFFQNLLEFYDIDRCTGVPILRSYTWFDNYASHGFTADLEWSPSGRYVYIAYNKIIMQLDMLDAEYWQNRDTIATWVEDDPDSRVVIFFGDLHTLPNGKILVSDFGFTPFMHLIQEPDLAGQQCEFSYKHYVGPCVDSTCNDRVLLRGIPRWVPFRMGPLEGAPCFTNTEDVDRTTAFSSLAVYPSPASSVVYCDDLQHGEHIVVHDRMGRFILETSYDGQIDVGHLKPGWYVVHSLDRVAVGRFVKIE